jgi:hypothetical protein
VLTYGPVNAGRLLPKGTYFVPGRPEFSNYAPSLVAQPTRVARQSRSRQNPLAPVDARGSFQNL